MRFFPSIHNNSGQFFNLGGLFGGGGGDKKETQRQQDIASQTEGGQNLLNQFLSQLVPGSEEFNQLLTEGAEFVKFDAQKGVDTSSIRELGSRLVKQQSDRIAGGGAATAQEARTNLQIGQAPSPGVPGTGLRGAAAPVGFEQDILRLLGGESTTTPTGQILGDALGFQPEEQDIFSTLRGQPTTTPFGDVTQQILDRARGGGRPEEADIFSALRGQPTTTPFGGLAEDVVRVAGEDPDLAFEQELGLLQDQINRQAAARGVARGGLPLEQLGRAGGELAVRQARERETIRRNRLSDAFALEQTGQARQAEALGDVQNLFNAGQGLQAGQEQTLSGLFDAGQGLRARDIALEEAILDLQSGRETRLTNLLQSQTGASTENLLNLLQGQTNQSIADRLDQQDTAEQRRVGLGQAIGGGLGAAGGFAVGGGLPGAAIGAGLGSSIGGGLAGGVQQGGTDLSSLLSQQNVARVQGGGTLAGGLSRGSLLRDFTDEEKRRGFQRSRSGF